MMLPLLFAMACGKGAPPAAGEPRAFRLVYMGNMDGEIEPCG